MFATARGSRGRVVGYSLFAGTLFVASACGTDEGADDYDPSRALQSLSDRSDGTGYDPGAIGAAAPTAAGGDAVGSAGADGGASDAASAESPATAGSTTGDTVIVCELAYYTGEFSSLGPSLTADITFPVEEIINEDPPLGRQWEVVPEDLGTVGEAQAAQGCLERHDAEIIVSIAHGYQEYRNVMMQQWAENDSPIVPSVHGGAIPGNLGGQPGEPIFRAQGLDEGLGTTGVLHAQDIGASSIVIFATDSEGFQLAADAAAAAAGVLGIEVLERIDAPAEELSYQGAVDRIRSLAPQAVLIQAGPTEAATLITEAAAAGLSLDWIGESNLGQAAFVEAVGSDTIATQSSVGFAAFAPRTDSPAWDFFSSAWNSTPGYGDEFGDADDIYHFSTYDVMVQTALAVEAAGSYSASAWAPAMREVGSAPGVVCHTYADCLALIRAGEDVDYEGVTGSGDYTDGGVNNVSASYREYAPDGSLGEPELLDPARSLELVDAIATQATCDGPTLPNSCEW
ncbi:MAG: ABC transporter substrate-binding protein [Actinomycetota bacterium]